jgi:PHD/YefM family antitoxin component YafN of YafNO toxin-antitoxin module
LSICTINDTLDRTIISIKHLSAKGAAMNTITANELKTKGIASIDTALKAQEEAIISVRGKGRYVVMDMETYNRLRVCELEAALYQARREIAEGQGTEESVDAHIARVQNLEP